MRILITGSTGLIGSRLVKALQKKHTIVEASRKQGIDITKKSDAEKIMKNVDIVVHAAGEIDESKPHDEIWKTNVEGTTHLLEAAENENVKQFIFISSVSVYGQQTTKVDEKTAENPQTIYEKSKAEAEKKVWNYQEVFPVTIIRPALVLGPNTYWKEIFKTIQKGFPLIGKGKNAWQMIYVGDLVQFIEHAVGNEDMYNEIYTCAEKETHTLREVADMMADIMHVKRAGSIPEPLGLALGHVFGVYGKITGKKPLLIAERVRRMFKHREYDTSKAHSTGWKPKHSTKEALEKTYHELKELKMMN